MNCLSERIINFYVVKDIIPADQKAIYIYGLNLILSDIINFTLILLIAAILGNIGTGILFLIVFCVTRVFSGGFHAKHYWVCKATMIVTFLSVWYAAKLLQPVGVWAVWCGVVLSVGFVLVLAPVKHPNKTMTTELRKKNRFRAILVAVLFACTAIVVYSLGRTEGIVISMSLVSVAVLMVIGLYANNRGKGGERTNE